PASPRPRRLPSDVPAPAAPPPLCPEAGASQAPVPPAFGLPLICALALAAAALCSLALAGCAERRKALNDGYYSSEAKAFDEDGWKDYLTIYVNNGQITIVEYDAKNLSGFRRSWDMELTASWNASHKVRPGQLFLSYQNALVTLQDPAKIQPLPEGRNMHEAFTTLAAAAIERAKAGDRQIAFVTLPPKRYPGEL
ncbi:MAG: hypothetical protein LBW85_04030, partial [Deltaproteobacteria bacterium]|nr:hypothetical protein [Deltaproteobacteria bacterium]